MSGGNRLYGIAARRWLITAILVGPLAIAHAQESGDAKIGPRANTRPAENAETNQGQPEALSPESVAPRLERSAPASPAPGRDLEYYARNDLIAQQRMADATDRLAWLTSWQIWLVAGETGLLMITVIVTARAARSASVAAKAAQESVKVASDTAKRQLRAYVNIANSGIAWENNRTARVYIVYTNRGQTPAYDLKQWIAVAAGNRSAFDSPLAEVRNPKTDLGPNASMTLHADDYEMNDTTWTGIRVGKISLYVWGKITYNDAFGEPRYTNYRLELTHIAGRHALIACIEGNDSN